jgi:hypothetical protein
MIQARERGCHLRFVGKSDIPVQKPLESVLAVSPSGYLGALRLIHTWEPVAAGAEVAVVEVLTGFVVILVAALVVVDMGLLVEDVDAVVAVPGTHCE